ncbi:MAG: protein-export chaperone SecB [Alphaproteobacteria bacterium]
MTDLDTTGGQAAADAPHLRVLAQYVKDLSFENPTAAAGARNQDTPPAIDMGIDVNAARSATTILTKSTSLIRAKASRGEDIMFLTELVYSGVFQFVNVGADDVEPLLLIECPRLLFPFRPPAVGRSHPGGRLPALLIDPIDFAALYRAQLRDREVQERRSRGAAPAN